MVGADGFEPSTSTSRTLRASQTALRPDIFLKTVPLNPSLDRPENPCTTSTLVFLNDFLDETRISPSFPLKNTLGKLGQRPERPHFFMISLAK